MNDVEHKLLADVVDSIEGRTSLSDALAGLVGVLQVPLELWQASVFVHVTGEPTARVLVHWSMAESLWEEGMEVSTEFPAIVAQAVALLEEDQVVFASVSSGEDSLVEHLLRTHGVEALLAMPLHHTARETLSLSLGSSSVSALKAMPISFWRGLASGIGERMYSLCPKA